MKPFREEWIKKNTKTYTNQDQAFRALLGGIGTGNVSWNAEGRLCDFEVMNHPDKGLKIPYTFFSLWSCADGEQPKAYVLETEPEEISAKALGYPSGYVLGLPRMDSCTIRTNYPFFKYQFEKEGLPLEINMESYTPFIPLDEKNSGIPGACIKYTLTNRSDKHVKASVCGTMYNFTGFTSYDGYDRLYQDGTPCNIELDQNGLKGIYFENDGMDRKAVHYGNLTLVSENQQVSVKPYWQSGGWWDGAEEFWQDFREDGELCKDVESNAIGSNIAASQTPRKVGSVCVMEELEPGETKEYSFYFTWYFPNRYGWWPDGHALPKEKKFHDKTWQNYYSTLWKDSREVAEYLFEEKNILCKQSRNFANALYSTTLDADVIESLVSAITVIRSNTCFRIGDGKFFAWEGCFERAGSCAGTCTHVWNYAQAMAFLFPGLERSARRTEFLQETDEHGNMAFRAKRLLDGEKWKMLPATDGQLGCVLRVFREWKLSGDRDFLKELWEKVVSVLEYSIKIWDPDEDGVLEAQQHNTYDIEFYGISSLTNSIFYAALKAGAEMAEYLGEKEMAEGWKALAAHGSEKMDRLLWNGSYYEQKIEEDIDKYKYQYGTGCLSDQLLGQELAHLYGLGYILPKAHVRSAVYEIYKNNFFKSLKEHESVQRVYAYPDESGLVLCSWPKGGRPKQPFVYSDEVWTGIEYQVATHLIYEGFVEEAMEIIHGIRRRYNGKRRSPYNEIECGNHYARSMAAWGLLIALSGFEYDVEKGKTEFHPRVNENDFTCFYSDGKSWGIYTEGKKISFKEN